MHNGAMKMLLCLSAWCFIVAAAEKPSVLFLGTRANYAWGYGHSGWLIDSSGAVRTFTLALSDSVGYFNQSDTMPMRIYNKLLAKITPAGRTIPADTLLSMQALIEPASEGIVSFGGMCNDYGLFRYSAFSYDTHSSRVKEIICYQFGDETACNSSGEAKKIARWLNSIDTMHISSCTPPDSCLNPTTNVAPLKTVPIQKSHPSASATFNLNGKKVHRPTRQIVVGRGGKVPVKF